MRDEMIRMLRASIESGHGVTLYLAGGCEVSIVVTELVGTDAVTAAVGRNQEYAKVVVDLAHVHACASY